MRGKQWANREKKKSLDTYSTTWINHGSSLKRYFLPSFARKPESRATREIFLNTSEHGRLINSRSCIHPLPSPLRHEIPEIFLSPESGCNLYAALQNFTLFLRDARIPDLNRLRLILESRVSTIFPFLFFIFTCASPLCHAVENSGFNPREESCRATLGAKGRAIFHVLLLSNNSVDRKLKYFLLSYI